MTNIAKLLIISGFILVLIGGIIYLLTKSNLPLGHLPGNIRIERENSTCVFALGTSILLSIILTILINLVARFLNK